MLGGYTGGVNPKNSLAPPRIFATMPVHFIEGFPMVAIIETGGKQYRVAEGQLLIVEKLEVEVGSTIDFDCVLAVGEGEGLKIGTPLVVGAKVTAEVVKHARADKIRIIKFRRRKHHMKHQGHRQYYTQVKITAIAG